MFNGFDFVCAAVMALIFVVLLALHHPKPSGGSPTPQNRRRILGKCLLDVIVLCGAFGITVLVRFEGSVSLRELKLLSHVAGYMVCLQVLCLAVFRVPSLSWRYIDLAEAGRICLALGVAGCVLAGMKVVCTYLTPPLVTTGYYRTPSFGALVINFVLSCLGVTGVRATALMWVEWRRGRGARRFDVVAVAAIALSFVTLFLMYDEVRHTRRAELEEARQAIKVQRQERANREAAAALRERDAQAELDRRFREDLRTVEDRYRQAKSRAANEAKRHGKNQATAVRREYARTQPERLRALLAVYARYAVKPPPDLAGKE